MPRTALLNRNGDVTDSGEYKTPFKDPRKRFGASLGNLSSGRVGIINMANMNLHLACIIGIRYSAVRRQFGKNPEGMELPVIEYQMQQVRLFPYLAASFLHHHFSRDFADNFFQFIMAGMAREDPEQLAAMGQEIHGLSSAAKPLAGWTAQAAIQECREACGGHGYLQKARFGCLRDDNDANCTYEGDNNVLLQQTSNWLLNAWRSRKFRSPFQSLDFLQKADTLLITTFGSPEHCNLNELDILLDIFHVLIVHLLHFVSDKMEILRRNGMDEFEAKNEAQFFAARTLALVFIQSNVLQRFLKYLNTGEEFAAEEKSVMRQLALIYALWNLEKYLGYLFQFGILTSGQFVTDIHETLLETCKALVPNAVALADVLSPPDFILNSVLGNSDGAIYKHLQQAFFETNSFGKSDYWSAVVQSNSKL